MLNANINVALRIDESNIKDEYIRAMSAALQNAADEYRAKGIAAEKIEQFEAQAKSLNSKAASLSADFFQAIKLVPAHSDGQVIARAVAAA